MEIPSRPPISSKKTEVSKKIGEGKELDQKVSEAVEHKGRVRTKEDESKGKEIMIPQKQIIPEKAEHLADIEESQIIDYILPTELLLMIAKSPHCDTKTANNIIRASKILYALAKTDVEKLKQLKLDWKTKLIIELIDKSDSLPLGKLGEAVILDPHLSFEENERKIVKAQDTLKTIQDAQNGLIQHAANLTPYSKDIMTMLGINALALVLPMLVVTEFPGLMALAALAIPMTYFFGATQETAAATGLFLKAPQMLPPGMAIAVIIAAAMVYSDMNVGGAPLVAFTTGMTALKDNLTKSIQSIKDKS